MKRLYDMLIAIVLSAICSLSADAQQVEYFWDTDPGVGKGQVLQTFTGSAADVQAELDVSTLSTGIHPTQDSYIPNNYICVFYGPNTSN